MAHTVEAHITLKAVATATDQGHFTAIAAAYTVDRDKEFIREGAFATTIKAWQDRGRPIPLHWAHKGEAKNVIGSVDPTSMQETSDGLYVEGTVDLEGSEIGKEAWRLVKSGTVGLSFGFLGQMGPERKDGTREIVEIDLFEVSLTPAPANPDARILTWKSVVAAEDPTVPDEETLRKQSQQLERELIEEQLPEVEVVDPEPVPDPVEELKAVVETLSTRLDELAESVSKQAEEADKESKARSVDPLRRRSEEAVLEIQSDGISKRKPPKVKEPDPPPEVPSDRELRRQFELQTLELLTGAK